MTFCLRRARIGILAEMKVQTGHYRYVDEVQSRDGDKDGYETGLSLQLKTKMPSEAFAAKV